MSCSLSSFLNLSGVASHHPQLPQLALWRGLWTTQTLRTLSNYDDGSENINKKINLRPLIRQMWATFPGIEFLRELSRIENLLSYLHVLYKTSHLEVSHRSRAVDVKEMY